MESHDGLVPPPLSSLPDVRPGTGALEQASHFPLPALCFRAGVWFSFDRLGWLLDNSSLQISRQLCQKPFLPLSTRTHSTLEVTCGHLEKQQVVALCLNATPISDSISWCPTLSSLWPCPNKTVSFSALAICYP